MIAQVTVHDLIFWLSMTSLTNCDVFQIWQRVHAIQNTRAAIVAQSMQQVAKINVTLNDIFLLKLSCKGMI